MAVETRAAFERVLRSTGWNLLGVFLPMAAALLAMPVLARELGLPRLGLLSLAWVLIGYFSLFDLGVGRALTHAVARLDASAQRNQLRTLCSTGAWLGLGTGLAGALLVLVGLWLVPARWLAAQDLPAGEWRQAGWLLAQGVVPTVLNAVLRGLLEGQQRFRLVNLVRAPSGVLMFAAPALAAAVWPRLDVALGAMSAVNWGVLGLLLWATRGLVVWRRQAWRREHARALVRQGGWMMVSNLLGPLIVYGDRFLLGALLPAARLAFYTVPFEMVSRLLVLPAAMTGALFPVLSGAAHADPAGEQALRRRATRLVAAVVLPAAGAGLFLVGPVLALWMGEPFAQASAGLTRWLLLGFVVNALAQVPYVSLQGRGLSRQTATLHLIELPLYLALLWVLVGQAQLEGAAWAWTIRGTLDWLALAWLCRRADAQNHGRHATLST